MASDDPPPLRLLRAEVATHVRRWLDIPDDEPDGLAQLQAMGVAPCDVPFLTRRPCFGPRSGLSDAARLLRGVDLGIVSAAELASMVTR